MRFAYSYKTSDNVRHEAEISAPSRDEAFAALRERGIRPIKVVAKDDLKGDKGSRGTKVLVGLAALAMVAVVVWLQAARRGGDAPRREIVAQGPATIVAAKPLARQRIPGDRERIESGKLPAEEGVFKFTAEAYLAHFAEPGRDPGNIAATPSEEDFAIALREPVLVASTDFTEVVDLKRIVAGMKLEMRTYLAGGGTVDGYLAELGKRQRLEISYRENAERRLNEMLDEVRRKGKSSTPKPEDRDLEAAYTYWLKANARLRSMGIYELPLPDALRSCQMGMELEN